MAQVQELKRTAPPPDPQPAPVRAIRHGLYSDQELIVGEDPEQFAQLREDTHADLRPSGTVEHALVDRIVFTIWRHRRLARAEWAQAECRLLPHRVNREARCLNEPGIDQNHGQPREYTEGQRKGARQLVEDLDRAKTDGWLPGVEGWFLWMRDFYPALREHIVATVAPHGYNHEVEAEVAAYVEVHFEGQLVDFLEHMRLEANVVLGSPEAVARLNHIVELIVAGAMSPEIDKQRYVDYQTKLDRQLDRLLATLSTQQQRRLDSDRSLVNQYT